MTATTTVSKTLVKILHLYAERIGAEIGTSEISWYQENDPGARLPAAAFLNLWTTLRQQSSDCDFGLHLVEATHSYRGGDLLTAVMLNCPTVGDAMERLCRYHALTTDLVQVHFKREGTCAGYVISETTLGRTLDRQFSEAICCQLFFILKSLSNEKMPFVEIHFRHPEPAQTQEHQRIFGVPIHFDSSEDQLIIHLDGLQIPIPLSDPTILQHLEAVAQSLLSVQCSLESYSDRVSQAIGRRLLCGENPSLTAIAADFAISARKLQKELQAEGATYRLLLDNVREEMALAYLHEPGLNLYDVAFLLGYSDQSAFNHAFKRWTGTSPGEYLSSL